jgi:hypothetical protein
MRKSHKNAWSSSDETYASFPAEINEALEGGAICALRVLTPRHFIDLMTRSSFEIGHTLKRGLRDALFEQRKQKRKKA